MLIDLKQIKLGSKKVSIQCSFFFTLLIHCFLCLLVHSFTHSFINPFITPSFHCLPQNSGHLLEGKKFIIKNFWVFLYHFI